jgi:anti-anti-sigma factor
VLSYCQRRPGDGRLRNLVTVADLHRDGHGRPARLEGHVVDITDDLLQEGAAEAGPDTCADADLDRDTLVAVVDVGPALVVLLCGEFDLSTRERLGPALDIAAHDNGHSPVYVDLSRVRFCEAHSLGMLVEVAQRLRRHRSVTLLDPYPTLRRALRLILARSDGAAIAISHLGNTERGPAGKGEADGRLDLGG